MRAPILKLNKIQHNKKLKFSTWEVFKNRKIFIDLREWKSIRVSCDRSSCNAIRFFNYMTSLKSVTNNQKWKNSTITVQARLPLITCIASSEDIFIIRRMHMRIK